MNILENFKAVKAFVFDIDGVLASDTLLILEGGLITRNMNSKDGHALRMAVRKGYPVAIISGSDSEAVKIRLSKLGVKDIFLEVSSKKEKLAEYILQQGLKWENVLYMGDDIPDYACPGTYIKTYRNTGSGQNQMPYNCPPAFDIPVNDNFARFINPVNINIKIIVDDITSCRDENRGRHQPIKHIGGKRMYTAVNIVIGRQRRNNDTIIKKELGKHDEKQIGPSDKA